MTGKRKLEAVEHKLNVLTEKATTFAVDVQIQRNITCGKVHEARLIDSGIISCIIVCTFTESMADFETIELDPSTKDAAFHKSDYAQVIFNNIAEIYSTDGDIECSYTVTSSLVPDTRDWVGLYKVGWRSSRDYVYFEWSPSGKEADPGTDRKNVVVFKGNNNFGVLAIGILF